MPSSIILASASPFRRMLLDNAGIAFQWQAAQIHERAIEEPLAIRGETPAAIALALAKAKALDVGAGVDASALVIGSDQTLSLGSRVFHKPADRAEALAHLSSLSGHTHQLNSAVAVAQGGKIVWEHVAYARMTMRSMTTEFLERHLDRVGDRALGSVGAYQLEGEGIQLFEHIEGDYFTILGLPMLPLLKALRDLGAIDA